MPRARPARRHEVRPVRGTGDGVRTVEGSGDRRQQVPARLLARAAGLGADPAVLVHAGVTLALVPARAAGRDARLEVRARERRVVAGVPRQDPRGRAAAVRAVQVGADARAQEARHA